MQVKKIMTKNPAVCTPDATLQEVAHMMEMYDCGCIPVVESHQTMRPLGTITDRDITIRTFSAGKNPLEMKASDIMTTDVATVTPDTSVEDCMNVMEDKEIRRILVADKNGKCVGIVAQADLLEHATNLAQTADFIREVSESDRPSATRGFEEFDRSYGNEYESNRSFDRRKTSGRKNYSFAQSESKTRSRETHRKPRRENKSFFNSTMLLTLLGSVGLGAGLRYFLGPETENRHRPFTGRKIKSYNLDAKDTTDRTSIDSSINTGTSARAATSSISSSTSGTENRETITGSVSSFNRTDDDDSTSTREVGRTATNS